MRRMFWLGAGAVLGIAGYRRLDRAAKSITGPLGSGQLGASSSGQESVTRRAVQVDRAEVLGSESSRLVIGGLRTSAGLAFSLAAGLARQAGALRARRVARTRTGLTGERRASIAGFLGDVRDGMDEYLDAHAGRVHAGQVERPARREIG
jgi:hypothetical protein